MFSIVIRLYTSPIPKFTLSRKNTENTSLIQTPYTTFSNIKIVITKKQFSIAFFQYNCGKWYYLSIQDGTLSQAPSLDEVLQATNN